LVFSSYTLCPSFLKWRSIFVWQRFLICYGVGKAGSLYRIDSEDISGVC
jgi:hypothetical protein